MIPMDYITAWQLHAPWRHRAQVEQDLVLSRALVEVFRIPELGERLAFRGGTALYKLHLHPAARYSEDIDLVQVHAEPIGETLDRVRATLDPWLGTPQRKLKEGRINLNYRFDSEDTPPLRMRLKIEINSREHFTELGLVRVPFSMTNPWFTGKAEITTFALDELLGTKLRALYQRKKGRDLFDLSFALERGAVNLDALLACFQRYMAEGGQHVTRAQFETNLHAKASDPDFRDDIVPILRSDIPWNFEAAMQQVATQLIARLPGAPWRSTE